MGRRTLAVIHAHDAIGWHMPFAEKMAAGLKALGIKSSVTSSQQHLNDEGFPILLGTSMWRNIEAQGHYLLVDRCSFGDTNKFVSLVWNGHGRRGKHCVPSRPRADRWKLHGSAMRPWQTMRSDRVVIAGQYESYSPAWPDLHDWYRSHPEATHIRLHPAQSVNNTRLEEWKSFDGIHKFITLNSSVAVEAILHGVPTVVEDAGGMAYPGYECNDDRMPWLRWLAWTQWHHDEIEQGLPISHIFEDV